MAKSKSEPKHGSEAHAEAAGDWRAATLAHIRALITQADPDIVEETKWRKPSNPAGVPVWSRPASRGGGMICTGETYKDKVKLTFAKGAALEDPSGLFNASLEGSTRRAIDIHEGEQINGKALTALIREAIALEKPAPPARKATPRPTAARSGRKPKGA
jgi:hypothetical protein